MQAVLRVACARVERALEPRKGEFLRRWVAGESIAGIAASAGMSRSHLSRRWRPQVLAAIDAEIANLRRELRTTGGRLVHEATESSQGPSPADAPAPWQARRWSAERGLGPVAPALDRGTQHHDGYSSELARLAGFHGATCATNAPSLAGLPARDAGTGSGPPLRVVPRAGLEPAQPGGH